MLPILKTFIFSFIGTILVPWISSKFGFQITSDQTTTLQTLTMGGLVSAGAALSHLAHAKATGSANSPPPAAKVSAHWLATVIAVALGLMVLSALTACTTLSNFFGSPTGTAVATAAVDVAVATAEQKGVTAAQINSIAKTALAADSGTAATLSAVSSVVNAQLAKLKLPAADLAAAQILEDALAVAIQAQIGANPNVATAQAAIADVLNAAIAATGG